jgi:acetate kinase
MGFTPLEGLVMGTRSGDIDPGAILYVMERIGMSPAAMNRELNEKSGLLGLSGRSADMRELLDHAQNGDPEAALAVEIFCRRARHYLAAYAGELGGVDAIVFGGGIGENSPDVRRRIAGGMQWAGIEMDTGMNSTSIGVEATISTPDSRAAVLTVPVDEASVIAAEAAGLLSADRTAVRQH